MQLDCEAFPERGINQFVLVHPKTSAIHVEDAMKASQIGSQHHFHFEARMLNADRLSDQSGALSLAAQSLGRVVSVCGSQATVGFSTAPLQDSNEGRATVGKFLGIRTGGSLLVGVITNVSVEASALAKEHGCHSTAALDLVGEIKQSGTSAAKFQRGVGGCPAIGDLVMAVGARELRLVLNVAGDSVIEIGHLQQDATIGAYV